MQEYEQIHPQYRLDTQRNGLLLLRMQMHVLSHESLKSVGEEMASIIHNRWKAAYFILFT